VKKIEAYIRMEKVGKVRKALEKVNFSGMTLYQVDGHGNQRGAVQKFNGEEYKVGILPKSKIEIIAQDKDVRDIVEVITEAARTGQIGDGKIVISSVEEVIRIRTGEKGEKAL